MRPPPAVLSHRLPDGFVGRLRWGKWGPRPGPRRHPPNPRFSPAGAGLAPHMRGTASLVTREGSLTGQALASPLFPFHKASLDLPWVKAVQGGRKGMPPQPFHPDPESGHGCRDQVALQAPAHPISWMIRSNGPSISSPASAITRTCISFSLYALPQGLRPVQEHHLQSQPHVGIPLQRQPCATGCFQRGPRPKEPDPPGHFLQGWAILLMD